jgi:hypothetical protein
LWQLGLLQLQDVLRLAMAGKGESSAAHGRRLQPPQAAPTGSCNGLAPQAAHTQHGQAGAHTPQVLADRSVGAQGSHSARLWKRSWAQQQSKHLRRLPEATSADALQARNRFRWSADPAYVSTPPDSRAQVLRAWAAQLSMRLVYVPCPVQAPWRRAATIIALHEALMR